MATCKDCAHYNLCNITQIDYQPKNTIQHIEEYCRQFKDPSRLVYLPCKAGDRLYVIFPKNKHIAEYVVIAFWVEESGIVIRIVDTRFFTVSVLFTRDIGTTAFLTREEAEQALTNKNQPDNTPH